MNTIAQNQETTPFQVLHPDTIIELAEQSLGIAFSNIFRPLNSYINRVYELEAEDGTGVIIKFYRPSRWAEKAILDEHHFLLDLGIAEIPVIPPMKMADGSTLGKYKGIPYVLFPKCGGRSIDEFTYDQWLELGRLLGRTHLVGSMRPAYSRIIMAPEKSTREHTQYILDNNLLPLEVEGHFRQITDELINEITPLFDEAKFLRIHGDCHFSNIIYRPGESFFLIDFDDMAMGTPVQDFWMLLPGHVEDSLAEIDMFLEGYETFFEFDRKTLHLIEPLRAMRYLHYMAWCGQQVHEDGSTTVVSDFGSLIYWQNEIKELSDQLKRINKAPKSFGNC